MSIGGDSMQNRYRLDVQVDWTKPLSKDALAVMHRAIQEIKPIA